jgi:hypothetical protein
MAPQVHLRESALQSAVEVKAWRNRMKTITLAATAVAASLLLLTAGAPLASAATFDLTSCHISGGCGTATQFGTVTLTDNQSGGVLFDVVLNSGNYFVYTGAGAFQWFVFNDQLANSTITGISATVNGTTVNVLGGLTGVTNLTDPNKLHADGTGDFSAGVGCTTASSCNGASGVSLVGGGTAQVNDLHFTVTNATIAQLETLSTGPNGGQMFVADIYLGQPGGSNSTGPVDSSPASVPDGGMTLMLLGGALVGVETLRRRIRS